jgi:Bifunctional DNA primase/polymerase, N-terminal
MSPHGPLAEASRQAEGAQFHQDEKPVDETRQMAQNLARNCGWHLFPCRDDKRPTLKRWPELASKDPAEIERLWREHPGPLIGILTGEASGVDVLDLDAKHDPARAWYAENRHRIPSTRTFRTRSGGTHFYFRHSAGVRNTASKIAEGVDTRGDGGYVISWFAAGLPCLDHAPPAPWPPALLKLLLPPPVQPVMRRQLVAPRNTEAAILGILQTVSGAPEGQRNQRLNWAAFRLGERVCDGQISRTEAETLLTEAATAAGLIAPAATATIRSGLKGAGAS